ncbi:hypothetical protein Y032_0473g2094 [Ancylostoma ceylanicum]|uniref:Uncharacterized protein n=1 Tax=Ancylostoma ceylanicum TaxID=53326 RepID=A0A016WXU7_9BILA|nr:hypothetical protein Y032_0473g2094 [Ancylostoma ceylanicum]
MCHPSRFFGFLTSCSFGTSTFILCHFIQCHFIVQEITRQKRSIAKKFSTKNEITSLKSEYTSEWIRKNEDFFSTFSLEYEPAYACEIIRLTDDLFSEVQSSKPCNFDSSLKAFIPKSPEDNSMINHEATATSPFADVNDRRRHERYVRHLVAKKLKSQKPLKKESSVLVRISIAEANKPGESCVQKRKSLNELFRELEISLKRAVLRNGDQEKDEESEEDML